MRRREIELMIRVKQKLNLISFYNKKTRRQEDFHIHYHNCIDPNEV